MTDASASPQPSLLTRSVENISTVLGIWHASRKARPIYASTSDVLVPALLLLLVQATGYRMLQPHAELNISVLQNFAGSSALALAAMAVILTMMRKGQAAAETCVGVLWAFVFGTLLSTAALMLSDPVSLPDWMLRRFGLVFVVPLVFLVWRLQVRGVLAFFGLVLPTVFVALPWFATLGASAPSETTAVFDPDVEMVYASQEQLLDEQFARLRPSEPGTPELFAVLGAGYPFEGVFRREVEAVGPLLSDRFLAQDRILSLVNDDADVTSYPLMNRVNLAAALGAVTSVMDPEDILFLFITTHGGPDVLSTSFDDLITRDVTAQDINRALQNAGEPNTIIVLPACYSGSFADPLARPNRLILTGADADSVSFGCDDQQEWTEWGRAFFVKALAQTRDPREAAELAQRIVKEWEAEQGYPHSSPLIVEGEAIGRILDSWLAELSQRL
jgi:hypothetical protein